MKFLAILVVLALAQAQLPYVSNFLVADYLGNWYEVASSPIVHWTFEKNGYCVRATYGLETTGPQAGDLSVLNVMRTGGPKGPVQEITGYAYPPNPSTPAQLEVQLSGTPLAAYWVVQVGPIVDKKYQWAIVSEPSMTFMWVLARDPFEYEKLYEKQVQQIVYNLDHGTNVNHMVLIDFFNCALIFKNFNFLKYIFSGFKFQKKIEKMLHQLFLRLLS
ncbi:hypothetical protein pb186bvf_021006 [Paramecium bursaria]